MVAHGLLQQFDPAEFDLEFHEGELARHGITADEVVEVVWNGFEVRRNKRIHGGYQLIVLHRQRS